ncbi:hypothetical protein [Bacillus atrophaeus]|uniref:hypothetical protein n=1 Tax=Bacillus atrophaeus TaxID=1452 RepID=UPI002E20BA34|nr:hypothetical protein [Bacillus atrophaeus]
MTVHINRKDRGLDFKRIEKIIEIFRDKNNKLIRSLERDKNKVAKEYQEEAYGKFGLSESFEAINAIKEKIKALRSQIDDLEDQMKPHKDRIRDYTQGSESRWGSYDEVREGSPIYEYIHEKAGDQQEKKSALIRLDNEIEEKLWLAKDIEEAIAIYEGFCQVANSIMAGELKNDS